MAERSGFTSGARDLDFIAVNPAREAFNEAEKTAIARKAAELAIESTMQSQAENRASAPSRLRTIEATADLTRSNADVGQRTVDSRVSQQSSAASSAATAADVAAKTAPYTVDNAYQGNRATRANTDVTVRTAPDRVQQSADATRTGTVNADVAVATKPDKIAESGLRNRQLELSNQQTELNQLKTQLDMIDTGRVEEAKALAAAAGRQIPQAIIENAELRTTLKGVVAEAEKRFPNRPKDQQAFIKAHMDQLAAGASNTSSPMTPYTSPPGAPEPPEDTTRSSYEIVNRSETDENGKPVVRSYKFDKTTGQWDRVDDINGAVTRSTGSGAGGGGSKSVYQQKLETYRAAYPNDETGALAYASGRKQLGDADLQRAAASILNAKYPKPLVMNAAEQTKRNAAYQEILTALRASNNAPAVGPGAPAPAASPAPAPAANPAPQGLTGAGTKEAPFQATTQDHVNWFKTSAPKGSVILINGKPYTK
jgi:hypothetical protein